MASKDSNKTEGKTPAGDSMSDRMKALDAALGQLLLGGQRLGGEIEQPGSDDGTAPPALRHIGQRGRHQLAADFQYFRWSFLGLA